jgi:hypothetical protein
MKKFMAWLNKRGAHSIIRATFAGFILWGLLMTQFPFEWIGFWVFVLILAGVAVLLLVNFTDAGRTWDDRE